MGDDCIGLHPNSVRVPMNSIQSTSVDLTKHIVMHVQPKTKGNSFNMDAIVSSFKITGLHIIAIRGNAMCSKLVALRHVESHTKLLEFQLRNHESSADFSTNGWSGHPYHLCVWTPF